MSSQNYDWRTGRSCIYKNFYHFVFVTKYRRDVFTQPMLDRLALIFLETCMQMECECLEFNGENIFGAQAIVP